MDRQDAIIAEVQLQWDTGLLASYLAVLNLYVIALHRMSTEVLQRVFGQEYFPARAVDYAAPVPRVLRASTQMATMGLWRPPVGPGGPGPDTVHQDGDCRVVPDVVSDRVISVCRVPLQT